MGIIRALPWLWAREYLYLPFVQQFGL